MSLPRPSPRVLDAFAAYTRRYLGRHFHAVRQLRGDALDRLGEGPRVVFCNHPAWWDPLVGLHLARTLWPEREHYAPIDAEQLERYGFFAKLGFFPVEQGTRAGARRFLETAAAILERPLGTLWVTPQGRFGDPRERPPQLEPGIGHLASRGVGVFVPLALEYPFWEEKRPEALVAWGAPIAASDLAGLRGRAATQALARGLEETQDRLAAASIGRDREAFAVLLGGRGGMGGVYEAWKRLTARLSGRRFRREHGTLSADPGELQAADRGSKRRDVG